MIPNENDSYYIIADINGLGKQLVLNPDKKYSLQTIDLLLAGFKTPQENQALNGFTKKEFYEKVAELKKVDVKDINDIFIVHVYLSEKENVYNMTFHRPIYKDNYKDENIRIAQLNVIKMLRERIKTKRNKRRALAHEPKIINFIQVLMAKAYTDYNLLIDICRGEIPVPEKIRIILLDYIHSKAVKDQQYITNKICESIKRYSEVRQLATAILTKDPKRTYDKNQNMYPAIMFKRQDRKNTKKEEEQLDLFTNFGVNNPNKPYNPNNHNNESGRVEDEETTKNIQEEYINYLMHLYYNGQIEKSNLLDTIYKLNDLSELANMSEDTKNKLRDLGIKTHKL